MAFSVSVVVPSEPARRSMVRWKARRSSKHAREKVQGHIRDTLPRLIETSVRRRVLTGHAIEAANIVKVLGDPAVHGNLVKEQDAKKMVTYAREVVLAVFGGRMEDESRPAN